MTSLQGVSCRFSMISSSWVASAGFLATTKAYMLIADVTNVTKVCLLVTLFPACAMHDTVCSHFRNVVALLLELHCYVDCCWTQQT